MSKSRTIQFDLSQEYRQSLEGSARVAGSVRISASVVGALLGLTVGAGTAAADEPVAAAPEAAAPEANAPAADPGAGFVACNSAFVACNSAFTELPDGAKEAFIACN